MTVAIKFTEKYLSTAEAAKQLGVSTDTIKKYCNSSPPRLKAEKVGYIWMIPQSEVKRYRDQESSTGRPKNIASKAS